MTRLTPPAGVLDDVCLETFRVRAKATYVEEGFTSTGVMIGKPWSPVPQSHPAVSLENVREFNEPGWLKYGMDWHFTAVTPTRTLVETSTLCEATDARARAYFTAYWALIRVGSGLIRRDLLATIGRLGRQP